MSRSGTDSTDLSILDRVRARDPGAWRRLVDLYGPLVHSWCCRARLGAEDAADVFQEVFLAVAAHIGDFRRDRDGDTFRGWLRTITRNKVHDHFRHRQDRPEAEGGTEAGQRLAHAPAPELDEEEDPSGDKATRALLHRALDLIRGDYDGKTWLAFWRATVEGRNATEVGAALGVSPNAVRKAKARVLRRLRKDLEGLLP